MKLLCCLFAWTLCGIFGAPASAQLSLAVESRWRPTNPGGGGWFERVTVGSDGTLVACSDLSGAYISRDDGGSWEAAGPGRGLTVTHVGSAAFDPNHPNRVFLGTDDGIFRSTDGAQTFAEVYGNGYIEHVAVSPSVSSVAYAAWHPQWNSNQGRVLRSTDGGTNWQLVSTNLPGGLRLLKILVAANDANTLYVLSGDGRFASGPQEAYRSRDGGVTWSQISAGFNGRMVDLALDEFTPSTLWASVDDAVFGASGHLYKSLDEGTQWNHIDQRGGYLWLHSGNSQTIRMVEAREQFPWDAREGIWESTQGGAPGTWVKKSSVSSWPPGWSTAFWTHLATSIYGGVSAHPTNPDVLYWVNSQFIYGTRDAGFTVEAPFTDEVGGAGSNRWQSRGFDNVVVMDVALNESNPDELYAGFFDLGTWRSLDAGDSWTPLNEVATTGGWNGAGGNTWSVLPDPARPSVVWAPQGGDAYGPHTLLFSTNAGDTWQAVGAGLPAAPLLGLSLNRQSSLLQRTLFLTAEGDVYRSTDGGVSWLKALDDGGLRFTAVDRFDGSIVYAGGESGLWRSTQGGALGSWVDVGLSVMSSATAGEPFWGWHGVYDIEPDPHQSAVLYVAVHGPGRGLYRSTDSGATWEPRLLADEHLRCVAIHPVNEEEIYATSSSAFASGGYEPDSNGVWRSLDGGQSWKRFNRGLDWPLVHSIVIDPKRPTRMFLGSQGTGIHRRDLPWGRRGNGLPAPVRIPR